MKRISTATRVLNKFGAGKDGYTDGDVVGGIPATDLEAGLFDNIQEELCNIIEGQGIALNGAVLTQLGAAIRKLCAPRLSVVIASGSFTVPADVYLLDVEVWGGGGGSGGIGSINNGSAGGGGGGGYARGLIAVTPGQVISCTVGAAGAAAIGGANGGGGGTTTFGVLSATGGAGGTPNGGGVGGSGGTGSGGLINLTGVGGGGGLGAGSTGLGASGGSAPMSGGGGTGSIGIAGSGGIPGGGGGGPGSNSVTNGAPGARGQINIRY